MRRLAEKKIHQHTYAKSDNGKRCITCDYLLKFTPEEIKKQKKDRAERYASVGWSLL